MRLHSRRWFSRRLLATTCLTVVVLLQAPRQILIRLASACCTAKYCDEESALHVQSSGAHELLTDSSGDHDAPAEAMIDSGGSGSLEGDTAGYPTTAGAC